MLLFHSTVSSLFNFYGVDTFNELGQPTIVEKVLTYVKYPLSPYKIFVIWRNSTVTNENINKILPLVKDYDGLCSYKDIKINLRLLSPFASKIIFFSFNFTHKEEFSKFTNIKYLVFGKNYLDDLSHIEKLRELVAGGTDFSLVKFGELKEIQHMHLAKCRNLFAIPFKQGVSLRFLQLSNDRDTKSFEFIKELDELEIIGLYHVSQLSHWPDSSRMVKLQYVDFDNVNRLSDFSGLIKAPNLQYLKLWNRHIEEKSLEQLMDCQSLKKVWIWTKSDKQSKRFSEILGDKFFDDIQETWPYDDEIIFD